MTAPTLASPATDPVALPNAEIFQAAFEHAGSRGETLLPAGLAPTNPTLVTMLAVRAPDSPMGPFTFAQLRVSCRSGARARALVVATAVDGSSDAREWLSSRWGIGGDDDATATYERSYHQVRVASPWFDVTLASPKPIGLHDVQFVAGLHPVAAPAGERLAQVELHADLARVERGHPMLHRFSAPDAAPSLQPVFPVAATSSIGTLTLPAVRFLLHPDVPPPKGNERVGDPATTS